MSTEGQIETIVKTLIQTEIVKALNNAPEAIEKLVQAALSRPVDYAGKVDGYGAKTPYLDYLIGNEIRHAAEAAVRKVVAEHSDKIEAHVREGLSAESVVSAMTKAILRTTSEDWRIFVSFEKDKDR